FMLYVDNWSNNGVTFNLTWDLAPANILDCTLPLEFLSFEAEPKARQVDLRWTTGHEVNTAYFQVERSVDGVHFGQLGRVEAGGYTQGATEYLFVDAAPAKGTNYYRLDQVDGDGARDYSKVVTATYSWGTVPLNVYPNPAGESLWAAFEMPEEGSVGWRITDMSGRIVSEGLSNVAAGMNQVEVPLARIDAGSYLLEVLDGSGVSLSNARFVKQ
ncbi:MAG: T9SS type A sorting domain-containing protein, partial [Flavobacteriales bacterium]